MKKRHNEEQIIYALKRLETGSKGLEVCREMGISEQTLYNWKRKYSGIGWEVRPKEVGRGKPEAEAIGGRSEPGQAHFAGGGAKKALKPDGSGSSSRDNPVV